MKMTLKKAYKIIGQAINESTLDDKSENDKENENHDLENLLLELEPIALLFPNCKLNSDDKKFITNLNFKKNYNELLGKVTEWREAIENLLEPTYEAAIVNVKVVSTLPASETSSSENGEKALSDNSSNMTWKNAYEKISSSDIQSLDYKTNTETK